MGEEAILEKALLEFSNLDQLLNQVESYIGVTYPWPTFNVLIIPANYPYVGMENPQLTFFSAACVTDNKELVYEMIQMIVAQWTGNMVSTQNFNDFWLNVGFSTFI